MRPETLFWQQVKSHLTGHVTRVENAAGNGMPDINVVCAGREYWIELKIAENNGTVLVRKEQRVWMKFHRMNGGKCFVLAKHDGMYYLFDKPELTEQHDDKYQRLTQEPGLFKELKKALEWIHQLSQ